jgi:hypothetical protein
VEALCNSLHLERATPCGDDAKDLFLARGQAGVKLASRKHIVQELCKHGVTTTATPVISSTRPTTFCVVEARFMEHLADRRFCGSPANNSPFP